MRIFTGIVVALVSLATVGNAHAIGSKVIGTYVNNGKVEVTITPVASTCWKPRIDKPATIKPGGHLQIITYFNQRPHNKCVRSTTNYEVTVKPKGGTEYNGGISQFYNGSSKCQLVGKGLYTNPPFPTIPCVPTGYSYFYTWTMGSTLKGPASYTFDACWTKAQKNSCR